ncbi:type 1 fimbrial protein [Pseudomonas monteilii]|nr:type 1 fimbrial protein [Pseudomonas monteilii]
MKKPLTAAFTLLLGATAISAHAADGMVKITGSVLATTCKVDGGKVDTGPQGSLSAINVELEPVSKSSLDAPGKVAGGKTFKIALSGCAAKTAQVLFETMGTVDTETGNLKNNGDAQNVQVGLYDMNDNRIVIGQDSTPHTITLSKDGNGSASFKAYYVATGGAATPGSVDSSAIFSLKYD